MWGSVRRMALRILCRRHRHRRRRRRRRRRPSLSLNNTTPSLNCFSNSDFVRTLSLVLSSRLTESSSSIPNIMACRSIHPAYTSHRRSKHPMSLDDKQNRRREGCFSSWHA